MCHVIHTRKTGGGYYHYFYEMRTLVHCLVGKKEFLIFDGELRPLYRENFIYRFINESFGLISQETKNTQPVEFHIKDSEAHCQIVRRYFSCGYHIYPISQSGLRGFLSLPVVFSLDDVLFFDGETVSVSKFFLPNPKILKEEDVKLDNLKGYEWYYKKIENYYTKGE